MEHPGLAGAAHGVAGGGALGEDMDEKYRVEHCTMQKRPFLTGIAWQVEPLSKKWIYSTGNKIC